MLCGGRLYFYPPYALQLQRNFYIYTLSLSMCVCVCICVCIGVYLCVYLSSILLDVTCLTGESDQYFIWAQLLRLIGVMVETPSEDSAITALGITAHLSPCIILHPSCCVFPSELRAIFPTPADVCISQVSSLVMKGEIFVESLVLDGALRLTANEGSPLFCRFHLSDPITNFGK